MLLIGGHVVELRAEEVNSLMDRLHAWEERPGEDGGVAALLAWLEDGEGYGFVPLEQSLAAPPSFNEWTETPKRLLLMRIDFPDLQGAREEQSVLIDKLSNSVSPVIADMSYGKTNLMVTVTPEVFRMPEESGYYPAEQAAGNDGNSQLHTSAQEAAIAAGYVMENYDFLCVQFASIGMGYGGLAIVGGKRSWIQSSGTSVFAHEFGHNYGVGHASRWIPTGSSGDPFDLAGTSDEYGGDSSIMGSGPFPDGHFDSQAKAFLNWLDADQWRDVASSGQYRLYRADHQHVPGQSQLGALRIVRPDGSGDFIWIGYKKRIGADRRLARGVQVLWEKSGSPRRNWIVRAGRTGSFNLDDYELPTGQTFSDVRAGGSVHVTPIARGGAPPAHWIDVDVQLNPAPGNQAPVASWLRVPSGSHRPFSQLSFTVSASDPDGDTLAYHWDFGDGTEVSVNLPDSIHTYTSSGLYPVTVEVSDQRGGKFNLSTVVDTSALLGGWTQRVSGTTNELQDGAASLQRVVAVTLAGEIIHSQDGANWTRLDLKTQQGLDSLQLYEVRSNGSDFLAVGQERDVAGGAWQGCIYTAAHYDLGIGKN